MIYYSHEGRCNATNEPSIKRGDIFFATLSGSSKSSSVQQGRRPVIIIQNDVGNMYSPTTIVAPLTSKKKKRGLPTHVIIRADEANGLRMDSVALLEQVRSMDKSDLGEKVGTIQDMSGVDHALMVSVGLVPPN